MSFINNSSLAAALCIQYLQRNMPITPAQLAYSTGPSFALGAKEATDLYTNCVNNIQRLCDSRFLLPHLSSPFSLSHDMSTWSPTGNHHAIDKEFRRPEQSSNLTLTVDSVVAINTTKVDNAVLPSFNVNGEPQLLVPTFVRMVEERGVDVAKLNEMCDELKIQCTQATTPQIREAKLRGLIDVELKSLLLMFKSDAERLCKQLFHMHPTTQMESNIPNGIFVYHNCFGKERGSLFPDLYTEENACCIKCSVCQGMLSPKSFVGHTHRPEEMNVRHWGFDSENWRSYLTLDKQKYICLDDNTMGSIKQAYDNVKALFAHKFKLQVNTSKLSDVIPPPPVHLNMGNYQQTSSLDLSKNNTNSFTLSNPVAPKSDDTQYNEKHVPNVSLDPMKHNVLKRSSPFHSIVNERVLKVKLECDTDNFNNETALISWQHEFKEELNLIHDLIKNEEVITCEDRQLCLERFATVNKKYLTTIKTLNDALSKANEHKLLNNMEWKRKFETLEQKKRTLKRALTDYPEPHRKQFIQLRYKFELEQERNKELQDSIDALRQASNREKELILSLEKKTEEAHLAQLEVDELREKLHRLKRLRVVASNNNYEHHKIDNNEDNKDWKESFSSPCLLERSQHDDDNSSSSITDTTTTNCLSNSISCPTERLNDSPHQHHHQDDSGALLDDERNLDQRPPPSKIERMLL